MKTKIKRIVAFLIDFFLYTLVLDFLTPIVYNIIPENNVIRIIFSIFYYVSFGLLLCMKDIFFGNESIGKKLMKLKIVDSNGEIETDKKILFKRNFYSLFSIAYPLYPCMILFNNKSLGDIKTKSEVKEI